MDTVHGNGTHATWQPDYSHGTFGPRKLPVLVQGAVSVPVSANATTIIGTLGQAGSFCAPSAFRHLHLLVISDLKSCSNLHLEWCVSWCDFSPVP